MMLTRHPAGRDGGRSQAVDVRVVSMAAPDDVSGLEALIATGQLNPMTVVAIVGKAEGTGLAIDPGRTRAERATRRLMAAQLRCTTHEVDQRVSVIFSGGCFGVLAPHMTVISRRSAMDRGMVGGPEPRLVIGRARSSRIRPEGVGRMPQILATAAAVRVALADAGMDDVSSVHAVLVKGPALSAASAQRAVSRGKSVVTTDIASGKDNAMSFSNDASALGVALALGEVRADDLSDDVVRRDWELHSSVAIASAEANRSVADVVVLGNSASSASTLRIGHSTIRSLIDADGVAEALRSAGLPVDCRASEFERSRIVQIFAKLVVPDSEELGGGRLTIHGDPSLSRTAKVIGGVLVAAVTGMTRVFVSGGEQNSHQGPPGGSPVAAIVRAAETEA